MGAAVVSADAGREKCRGDSRIGGGCGSDTSVLVGESGVGETGDSNGGEDVGS